MVSELPPFYSRIVFISSLWFTEQLKTAKLKLLCLVNENFKAANFVCLLINECTFYSQKFLGDRVEDYHALSSACTHIT